MFFDKTLSWEHHINYVSGKIYGMLSCLWKVAKSTDKRFKLLLFKAYLLPHFLYADIVLFGMNGLCKRKLNMCYNSCVRFIFNLRKFDHISSYVNTVLGCSLSDYMESKAYFFILNVTKFRSPDYIYERLNFAVHFNENQRLIVPASQCRALHDSLLVNGVKVLNSIPIVIKKLQTITAFRGRYLEWRERSDFI